MLQPSSDLSRDLDEAGTGVVWLLCICDVLVVEHADFVRGGVSPHRVVDSGFERSGLDEPRQLVMEPT